jgi:ATP-binding cassette subfamily B protein
MTWVRRLLDDSAFIRHYVWKYRRPMAIGIGALVFVDALEILPPLLQKSAVDSIAAGTAATTLWRVALAYFGVALLQAVCRYGWRMFLIRTSLFAARDLRNRFAGHLFRLSTSFFDRRRIGDLMSLENSDIDAVRIMIGAGILTLADALFYFLAVPVAMFMLSPKLTLLALIPLPIIPWLVSRNEREIYQRFARAQECLSRISSMTQENLAGVRVVKGLAGEDGALRRFRALGEEYGRLSLHLARVQTAFGPTLDFTMSLGLALLLYFGGRWLIGGEDPALTLGVFVAFQRYIQQMVWPMAAVGLAFTYYRRSVASGRRLQEIFDETSDVADSPKPVQPARKTPGAIEFRNLRFRFPGASRDALQGITLDIRAGERIAFVGAIGSGKSALLGLLPRLYPVERGMVFIDGVDINDWPIDELRRQVGYVSQEVFLFSETVVENVAFGLRDWENGNDGVAAIQRATELAAVHEEILGLAESYETRLGERGVNLSGGQKQRLTIARALAKEPSILILDDALSNVDVRTEERILRALRERPHRNTEIVAAHRISTIQDADRIVALAGGRIAQVGTHRELIADTGGLYWKFYEQQRLREDLERYMEMEGEPS